VAKYGWHRTNKALLQAAGHMHRRDRMPLQHLTDEEYVLVQSVYETIASAWTPYLEQVA
jgi:4-hydroxy-tetrahydrodipicolinate synthase